MVLLEGLVWNRNHDQAGKPLRVIEVRFSQCLKSFFLKVLLNFKSSSTMQEAKRLHAYTITAGLQQQELYLRKLITFFAISNPSSLNYARLIFDQIQNPSTFIYNTLIRAYSASSDPQQALHLYNQMQRDGLPPDKYTFPFLLKACSTLFDLRKGEETHSQSIRHGFNSNIFVQNSLLHLYGSNGRINDAHLVFGEMSQRDVATWTTLVTCYANMGSIEMARKVFDKMPERSVVSYSAMISGYVRKGRYNEALVIFRDLQIEDLEPSDSMIMGVICACANLGSLNTGRWIHSYVHERISTSKYDSRITTALIDMYFKCGSVKDAMKVFVGAKEKNVGEWTAMITGMAMHGMGERSVLLFEEMVSSGIKPNIVTFVALLSGCSHGRLVNEGLKYFERMKYEFGIEPTVEHYGCVVDFLGRAGLIDTAMDFIKKMPMEANATMWSSLLNSCRVYKNIEVGELAARQLVKQEPWNGAVYMTLMSLYRESGKLEDVEKVKKEMKEVGCRKTPGCSLIELNGVCYEFVVGDKSFPAAFEMCSKIGQLIMEMKDNC